MVKQPEAGKALQRARFAKNLTLEQLSELSGVSVSTIVRVEKGESAFGRTIYSLAHHLDLEASELFERASA